MRAPQFQLVYDCFVMCSLYWPFNEVFSPTWRQMYNWIHGTSHFRHSGSHLRTPINHGNLCQANCHLRTVCQRRPWIPLMTLDDDGSWNESPAWPMAPMPLCGYVRILRSFIDSGRQTKLQEMTYFDMVEWWNVYFLLDMRDFQLAMLVYHSLPSRPCLCSRWETLFPTARANSTR